MATVWSAQKQEYNNDISKSTEDRDEALGQLVNTVGSFQRILARQFSNPDEKFSFQ